MPENQTFFVVFREYKMGTVARNGLCKGMVIISKVHKPDNFEFTQPCQA